MSRSDEKWKIIFFGLFFCFSVLGLSFAKGDDNDKSSYVNNKFLKSDRLFLVFLLILVIIYTSTQTNKQTKTHTHTQFER